MKNRLFPLLEPSLSPKYAGVHSMEPSISFTYAENAEIPLLSLSHAATLPFIVSDSEINGCHWRWCHRP